MEIVSAALSVLPAGSTTWVDIDPTSPTGQAFTRRLGFTTMSKEDTMSAAAIEQPTRHLAVVQNNVESMGLLLRARASARKAYDYMLTLPKAAWGWMRRTFHLDPALGFVADGFRWMRTRLSAGLRYLGTSGGVGVGLLAISTSLGRQAIATALKPIGWGLRLFGTAYTWVEDHLYVEGETTFLAGPRQWVSEKMADARQYVTGEGRSDGGLVGKVATLIAKVHPAFQMESLPMQVSRTAGTAIVGFKALGLLPLLALGSFAVAGQYLATAGVLGLTLFQGWGIVGRITSLVKRVFGRVEEVATGEDSKKADVVDIATMAAETGTVIAHGANNPPQTAAGNRAAKRAEARRAGRPAKAGAGAKA